MTNPLIELRDSITAIDAQILALLSARQKMSAQVAAEKIKHNIPVRDQKREEELLLRLVKQANAEGLDAHYVTRLFHVIIEDSVLNQQALLAEEANPGNQRSQHRVAFLGDKGSYSYLAMHKHFARREGNILEVGCRSFAEIVKKVELGEADYAVLPIENTSSGSINEVYDQLQHTKLSIVGELTHPIKHAILTVDNVNLSDVSTIYTHPQPFAQCSHYFNQHDHYEIKHCDSTSAAMRRVKEINRPDVAAIGSEDSAGIYGLTVVKADIANQKENHSRFIIVADHTVKVPLQVPAKTTLVMSTLQTPGALVDALTILKQHGVGMTKLESRPISGNPWEEMFYLDIEGNVDDGPMQSCLDELRKTTRYLKVLGCYPNEEISPTRVAAAQALKGS